MGDVFTGSALQDLRLARGLDALSCVGSAGAGGYTTRAHVMAQSFADASSIHLISPARAGWSVPDGWQQGRGAFGGLVFGALARALTLDEPERTRRLRTFTGDIMAPVLPGEAELTVEQVRRGKSQSNALATLTQGGHVVARASAILAAPREVPPRPTIPLEPPSAPAFHDVAPAELGPLGPRFSSHYEYRVASAAPFTAAAEPLVVGWVREKEPLARLDEAAILGRLDAHWPALLPVLDGPRPCATVTFLAEVLVDPVTLDPTEAMLHRGRVVAEADGYFTELRELWSAGRVVALNQQVFAVLG